MKETIVEIGKQLVEHATDYFAANYKIIIKKKEGSGLFSTDTEISLIKK